jgi:hypothetical protein
VRIDGPDPNVRWNGAVTVRNEEVFEGTRCINEAHYIRSVLSSDVEVIVGAKCDSDRGIEVAASVGEEVNERAGRRVVAPDA